MLLHNFISRRRFPQPVALRSDGSPTKYVARHPMLQPRLSLVSVPRNPRLRRRLQMLGRRRHKDGFAPRVRLGVASPGEETLAVNDHEGRVRSNEGHTSA